MVTGATSGIGLAIARQLLEQGRQVICCGRSLTKIETMLTTHPESCFGVELDYLRPETIANVERAVVRLGGVNGLVHAAGCIVHQRLVDLTEEALGQQMTVNLLGPIRLTKSIWPHVQDGASILFLSSTLQKRPIPTSSVYTTTKGGLDSFMRAVAIEGASRQITSNSLVLGMVDTPMIAVERPSAESHEQFANVHLLNRIGSTAEVAKTAIHVLSSSWVTGAEIAVDGGLLLK